MSHKFQIKNRKTTGSPAWTDFKFLIDEFQIWSNAVRSRYIFSKKRWTKALIYFLQNFSNILAIGTDKGV